jgi:hypothetical protein
MLVGACTSKGSEVHKMVAGSSPWEGMYKLKCMFFVAVWENTQRFMDGIRQELAGLQAVDLVHFCTKAFSARVVSTEIVGTTSFNISIYKVIQHFFITQRIYKYVHTYN